MEKYNMQLTAKGLYKKMVNDDINFDCAVQRSLVWDIDKKRKLIHSLLYGFAVPPFYLTKNDDGTFDSLDGKQRSYTIFQFMQNEWNLGENFPLVPDDEGNKVNFSGYYWEALPEWAKDKINDFSFTVYYFENMTGDEINEFFARLNNGKPLSAIELTRVKAKSLQSFQEMGRHPAIDSIVTEKGKARFNDEQIAMQCYAMAYMPNDMLDFSTKTFRPWIEQVEVTKDELETCVNVLNDINQFLEQLRLEDKSNKENARVLRRIKSKTHFVSTFYFFWKCKEMDITDFDDKSEAIYNFFKGSKTSTSEDYNDSIGAGSAQSYNVRARKEAINQLVKDIISIPQF